MSTVYKEFRCPKCDGRSWGGLPLRRCKGMLLDYQATVEKKSVQLTACTFTWPEEDDWKYMRTVVCSTSADDGIQDKVTQLVIRHMTGLDVDEAPR